MAAISGYQSVDSVGLYVCDICVDEVVTLDKLRQVSGRGAAGARFWFENLRVWDYLACQGF